MSSRRNEDRLWVKFYRAEAFARQSGSCAYCGVRLRAAEATADHRKPVVLGGQTTSSNIVVACQPCNLAKGQASVAAFKKRLRDPARADPLAIWKAWSRRRLSERTKQAERRILRWDGARCRPLTEVNATSRVPPYQAASMTLSWRWSLPPCTNTS